MSGQTPPRRDHRLPADAGRKVMAVPLMYLFALLLAMPAFAHAADTGQPDIKLNPAPKMRYEITATVAGAPGPFDRIEGHVDYKVTNRQCIPLTPISGVAVFPEKHVPLELHRIGENTFKAEFYADLVQDENYFDLGVCHWSVAGAGLGFHVKNISFSTGLFLDDIVAGRPVARFFANRSYFLSTVSRIDTGNAHRGDFQDDADKTFVIELVARETTP